MMAKPNYIKSSGAALYADEHQLKRVNSFSADASFTDEDILELANAGVAETIDDIDTVSVTVDCHEFGSTDNMANSVNFFQTGDNNEHYITDDSFDNAQVDFILQVTSGTNTNALMASYWYGGAWLSGYSASYSVDGTATESFTFEGEHKRIFMNAYRDTKVVSGTRTASTTATIYGANLQTGYTPRILTVNGEVKADVKNSGTITFTDASANTTVTATTDGSTAVSFAVGDRVRVVYVKNTAASFASLTSTPSGLGALRKGMIDIYLFNGTSGNVERTLRLQSLNYDIDLSRTEADQLVYKRTYARSLDRPINITVTAEALLDDLEMFAKVANAESTFDTMALNEIDIDDFTNDTKLIVKLYKSEVTHSAANLLKTIVIDDLSVSSDAFSVDAGGLNTVTLNFSAKHCIISGSSVSPFLG